MSKKYLSQMAQNIKQGLVVMGVLVGAAAAPLIAAKPASAATPVCVSGHICMWEHARSEGAKVEYGPARFQCYNLTQSWWDRASSVWNNTGHQVTVYTLSNCGGWGMDLAGTEYLGTLSGSGFNDEIRSFWSN